MFTITQCLFKCQINAGFWRTPKGATVGSCLQGNDPAPAALVAGLRETSIFFGTIFSALIMKERITFTRGLSIFMIVAGAIAIKMS